MILPQSLFNGEKKSFSEIFAEQQAKNRAEKEAVVKDLNAKISARDIYAPYQAEADKILTDAISTLPNELRVNPRAITEAVSNYTKYQSYSDQLKEWAQSAETSYKADNEVDTQTALAALRKKYASNGSLDKLEEIVNGGADAESILLATPGALKEDQVMVNRLKNIGQSISDIASNPDKLAKLNPYYYGMTTEQIKTQVSNAVQIDPSGRPIVRSVQDLDKLGINDALLGDDRVKALVDRRLEGKKIPITEQAQKEELRNMLQPYVSSTQARTIDQKILNNPEQELSIKRLEAYSRMQKKEGAPDNVNLLSAYVQQSLSPYTVNPRTGKYEQTDKFNKNGLLTDSNVVSNKFTKPEPMRNSKGQIIDENGVPLTAEELNNTKDGIPIKAKRAVSPAGIGFFGYNTVFQGKQTDRYVFGRTLKDKLGNTFVEAYPIDPIVKAIDNKPQYLPLEAGLLEGVLPDSKDRSMYQSEMARKGFWVPQTIKMYEPKKESVEQNTPSDFDKSIGITPTQEKPTDSTEVQSNPFAPKKLKK